MELRKALMPPDLDESKVARLADFAAEIDCGNEGLVQDQLAAFNREAMTDLAFIDFQGIYGGQDHETWVRKVLAAPYEQRLTDITRAELIEMTRRVMKSDGSEHAVDFWLSMLELNLPNDRVSDLIFWPDEYFGEGSHSRELSPEEVVDIALSSRAIQQDD
jgi:hypothetical protein